MIFVGVVSDFVEQEWNEVTSQHVMRFWNSAPNSPIFIGSVDTRFISQERISSLPGQPRVTSDTNADDEERSPLRVVYEQSVTYAEIDSNSLNDPNVETFLLPFQLDARPYLEEIANISDSRFVILLYNGEPEPPTASPTIFVRTPEAERRIIVSVVVTVATILIAAAGYIVYLQRKEEASPIIDGPLPYDENYTDDEDDYYDSGNENVPVEDIASPEEQEQQQPLMVGARTNGMEPVMRGSNQSDHTTSSSMGGAAAAVAAIGEGRTLVFDGGTGLTETTVPITIDGTTFDGMDLHEYSGDDLLPEDAMDFPPDHPDEAANLPSMAGFQMQIQDLDD